MELEEERPPLGPLCLEFLSLRRSPGIEVLSMVPIRAGAAATPAREQPGNAVPGPHSSPTEPSPLRGSGEALQAVQLQAPL